MIKILRNLALTGIIVLVSCNLFPERPPNILWEKTFGGENDDAGYGFCKTADEGFVIAGYTMSFNDNKDFYLVRTDSEGNQIWDRNYGSENHDMAYSVCPASDGGFITAGCNFTSGSSSIYIIKVNSSGELVWEKTFQPDQHSRAYSICPAVDGGYVIAGSAFHIETGFVGNILIMKIDESGDSLWTKSLDNEEDDWSLCINPTSDNGYIITGSSSSIGKNLSAYMAKTDQHGNIQWDKVYNKTDCDILGSTILQTSEGDFLFAGWETPGCSVSAGIGQIS